MNTQVAKSPTQELAVKLNESVLSDNIIINSPL